MSASKQKVTLRRILSVLLAFLAVAFQASCAAPGGPSPYGTDGHTGGSTAGLAETAPAVSTGAGADTGRAAEPSETGASAETGLPESPFAETPFEEISAAPSDAGASAPSGTDEKTADPAASSGTTVKPAATPVATAPPDNVFRTASGAGYTVSGAAVTDPPSGSIVGSGFTMTFEAGSFSARFNRMVFTYSSGEPLHVAVKYESGGKTGTDDFYLDAGENATFRGLVSSYLENGRGANIRSVEVVTCTKNTTEFRLHDLRTETVKVYDTETYFIEGRRFTVGIKLSWGGGINYIQDKTCKVSGLTNLINQADTGRLVQQSYYGTAGNSEYSPGEFNGSRWTYNPVQGGDKYGNPSRLIDIEVGTDYVYVKAQPQDWSLDGRLTKSYMENTYTVSDDVIRVDNRFTDYSGWTHRYSHQELPAFYTVSFLGTFTWYDGSRPWTDAPLAVREDLRFWGDAQYAGSCTFPIKTDNTETWCAWYDRTSDFGIGLYVPNIDVFYAGRFSYNGSKSALDGATNYVAPLNTIMMVSYEPIEYSYLITAGSVSAIRGVFRENRNFADNASLHRNYRSMRVLSVDFANIDLTAAGSEYVFGAANNAEYAYVSSRNAVRLRASEAADPWVYIEYTRAETRLRAEDYGTVSFEYMIPESNTYGGEYAADLFLCAGELTGASPDARVRVPLINDGKYHTASVDVGGLSFWKGDINAIRFDFFDACEKGDVMYVRNFRLK